MSKITHAKNAHPEWGYLAPAPSLMRATRIALIATAVGATVGCVVVLSLVDRSAGQTSVADRTLVQPMQTAAAPASAPENAQRIQAAGRNESYRKVQVPTANCKVIQQRPASWEQQKKIKHERDSAGGGRYSAIPNEVPPETTACTIGRRNRFAKQDGQEAPRCSALPPARRVAWVCAERALGVNLTLINVGVDLIRMVDAIRPGATVAVR